MPESLHDFEDIFNKESFDSLPDQCKWDHAIELEHDPEPGFCKVYPITLDWRGRENLMCSLRKPSPLVASIHPSLQ